MADPRRAALKALYPTKGYGTASRRWLDDTDSTWRDLTRFEGWSQFPTKLTLPGTAESFASTPDADHLDITGDIDIRAYDVAADAWASGGTQPFVVKYDTSGQRSWATSGLFFYFSANGTTDLIASPQAPPAGAVDGQPLAGLRTTRQASSGQVRYWHLDGGVWTQVGTTKSTTAGAMFAGTAPLRIGGANGLSTPFAGTVGRVEIRDGIDGTVVASPNFAAQPAGTTTFTDAQGNVWSVNGSAAIA